MTQQAQAVQNNCAKMQPPWERKLWFNFLKTYPIRFQRQKPLGKYIADFYCAKAKLVIELDGGGHFDHDTMLYDQKRTADLQNTGLYVLRINNNDIDNNFEGVCEYIDVQVKNRI